jgi:hypothetical protein
VGSNTALLDKAKSSAKAEVSFRMQHQVIRMMCTFTKILVMMLMTED